MRILALLQIFLIFASPFLYGYSYPTVTNTFSPITLAKSSQVNQNFNDILSSLSAGTKKLNLAELYISGTRIVDINRVFYPSSISSSGNVVISGTATIVSTTNIGTTDFVINTAQNRIGAFTGSPQYPFSIVGNTGVTGNVIITGTLTSGGAITGTLATASQPNITQTGTLATLNVTGALKGSTLKLSSTLDVTGNTVISGTLKSVGAITGTLATASQPNITQTGTLATLNVTGALKANGGITGTLQTAAQTNITSVGTLSSLGITGDLTVDTNTLYVKSASNNVGIGTTSPLFSLHNEGTNIKLTKTAVWHGISAEVNGTGEAIYMPFDRGADQGCFRLLSRFTSSGTGRLSISSGSNVAYGTNPNTQTYSEKFVLTQEGNVGIGTSTPNEKLSVSGSAMSLISAASGDVNFYFGEGTGADQYGILKWDSTNNYVSLYNQANANSLVIKGGNVGIGTTAPDKALEINSASGANLRLTYNDSNGAAANYVDQSVSSGGDLTINPSGKDSQINGNMTVTGNAVVSGTATANVIGTSTIRSAGDMTITPSGGDVTINGRVAFQESGTNNYTIKCATYKIGPWNMDTDSSKTITIAYGKNIVSNIVSVHIAIIGDGSTLQRNIEYAGLYSIDYISTDTVIVLTRTGSGYFDDGTGFGSTAANRGYITIWYY